MYPVLKIMHMLNFLDTFSMGITLIISILYRSKKRVGLHTHTHLRLVVGLNKEHKKCLIL